VLIVMAGGLDHVGLCSGVVGLWGQPAATAAVSAAAWAGLGTVVVVVEADVVEVVVVVVADDDFFFPELTRA
jgi:hypothetical protein